MAKSAKDNGTARKAEVRCAIYTRKSSEEGLEQNFNSLDAQREACEAFIRSQRAEGWVCRPQMYDDGGISGGTMERTALRTLLADIEAGQIDAVVVYKVDRLTRSLSDFAKIVEVFDARGVSFVSVTQQFNTTTSMGRLTLNMLLSFAQFEREVTGERIRDKIAASKRKGMWMGGLPPLGLDVKDRKLVVNAEEAKTVAHIFRRYAELGSVLALKTELDHAGIGSKVRVDGFGQPFGGKPFSRGALYLLLQNRIYRGEIVHKDQSYPGEHEAIIEARLWETVQTRLAANRTNRRLGTDAGAPSLLAGILFDVAGERLIPTHTRNDNGARYRYYISQGLIKGQRGTAPHGRRVPAGDLEEIVEARLLSFLQNGSELLAALHPGAADPNHAVDLLAPAADLARRWSELAPSEKRRMLLALLHRVEVRATSVEMQLLPGALVTALRSTLTKNAPPKIEPTFATAPAEPEARCIILSIPARLKRTGIEKRLLVDGVNDHHRKKPDYSLCRLLARAQQYHAMLMRGGDKTITQLAHEAGVTASYFSRVLRLSFLAPTVTTAILRNRHPLELTAKRLANETRLPFAWDEQRTLLGVE